MSGWIKCGEGTHPGSRSAGTSRANDPHRTVAFQRAIPRPPSRSAPRSRARSAARCGLFGLLRRTDCNVRHRHPRERLRQPSRSRPAAPVRRRGAGRDRPPLGPFHDYIDAVGFEPDPAECERLNREAASQDPPIRFLPYALAGGDEEVTFYEANWAPASSIYPPNNEFLGPFPFASHLLGIKGERRIRTVSLDQACRNEDVWPDYLKLDVEGAELQVLDGGERATGGALVLDLEVEFAPLREGQPLFADVDTYLRGRGWCLFGLRRVHWRRNGGLDPRATGYGGQLTQADALYLQLPASGRGPLRDRRAEAPADPHGLPPAGPSA